MRSISQMKKDLNFLTNLTNLTNFNSSFGGEQVGSGNLYDKYGIKPPPPPPQPQPQRRRVRRRLVFENQNETPPNPNIPRFGFKITRKRLIKGALIGIGGAGAIYMTNKFYNTVIKTDNAMQILGLKSNGGSLDIGLNSRYDDILDDQNHTRPFNQIINAYKFLKSCGYY